MKLLIDKVVNHVVERVTRSVVDKTRGGINWSSYWATRTPSNLYAIVYRDTEADLTWTDPSGDVPFRIYISTDGVNYTEKGTTLAGDNTYTATGLTAGTLYYFKVVAYNGSSESPATNVWDTYMKWTIDTTKAGSAADTFVLPVTANTGSYFVDWGDGGAEEEFTTTGNKSHTYAAQGTYQIKVRGGLTALAFNFVGDKRKLIYIDQWGNIKLTSCNAMFYDCSNMNSRALDSPNTRNVLSMRLMFSGCKTFNQSLAHLYTANVTSMENMLSWCSSFKQSLATLSLASATNLSLMLNGCNINAAGTTTNYDATLVAWAAQDPPNSLSFNGGTSKYGEGLVDNGTTDGVATNKLIQSGQNFVTTVTVGDVVYNTTDGTYALVTAIDSDTQLSISADIMANAEVYRIQHSAAAKARASLILNDLWTITDGGYL